MIASHPDNAPSASKNLFWALLWIAMTFYFVASPVEVMTPTLDGSNYGSYAWMFKTGKQFGTETIAMTGPFGFVPYGTTYGGELFTTRLIAEIILKAAFAFLVLGLVRRIRNASSVIWLGILFFFLPAVADLFNDIVILIATLTLWLNHARERSTWINLISATLLGCMGLMKGTHLVLSLAALFALTGLFIVGKRPGYIFLLWGIALASFLTGWTIAGQAWSHLPAYFRGVIELSSGYNEVMGLAPERGALTRGLVLSGLLVFLLFLAACSVRKNLSQLLLVLFLLFFGFIKWKHGYVRADGHVFIFYYYALLSMPLIWLAWGHKIASARPSLFAGAAFTSLAIIGVSLSSISEGSGQKFLALFIAPVRVLSANFDYIISPIKTKAALDRQLDQARLVNDLPQIRDQVGSQSIDFFGYEEGTLLLSNLNYQPRPMGGGTFNVFTPYLQKRNEAYLRDSAHRPAFQLVKVQTLDQRFPAADDPLTLSSLLSLYFPVQAQQDYLLFRARPKADVPTPTFIKTVSVRPGEFVPIPAVPEGQMLLFTLKAPYSITGKIRSFTYQPPLMEFALNESGKDEPLVFRLAPSMAQVPVILSPLIENNRDLLTLYGAGQPRTVTQIKLLPTSGGFANDQLSLSFYTLPFPSPAEAARATELLTHLIYPLSNRAPSKIVMSVEGVKDLFDKPIYFIHAPSQIVWPLQSGDQQLIFSYGLLPQAYDPGHTKGVVFTVDFIQSDGSTSTLFERFLQPLEFPPDRGMQWQRLFLPPNLPSGQLRISTRAGPTGDASWAQSYVTHVQIVSGRFDPRQLTGFSLSPLAPGFANSMVLTMDGRQARAISPSTKLEFPISQSASTVTIGAGLQPAAYRGDNRSDGVILTFTMIASGQNPVVLHTRTIDPLNNPLDRGTQIFVITLPENRPPDAHLILQVGPGLHNDDRWDWAYLETVAFH